MHCDTSIAERQKPVRKNLNLINKSENNYVKPNPQRYSDETARVLREQEQLVEEKH